MCAIDRVVSYRGGRGCSTVTNGSILSSFPLIGSTERFVKQDNCSKIINITTTTHISCDESASTDENRLLLFEFV